MNRQRAVDVLNLRPVDRIPHWEALACPAFEQLITGIDPYEQPRRAKQRMYELLPLDVGGIPASDDPIPRLPDDFSSFQDEEGRLTVRWGTGKTWHWDWGHRFKTIEDVLAYEPLQHMDQRQGDVVANYDYSLPVEELAANFQRGLDASREATGDLALVGLGFYNTLFMWPLLTFGWELFCYVAMLHPEEMRRLLRDFSERSRKIFKALALTDVEMITSHDDICCARGPSFSPRWLREFIYPYYEEFWSYPREAGIKVIFVCDGNLDDVADDIFACGADGIRAEPFTNWRSIALRHPDKILSGEGDARILGTQDQEAIEREVKRMVTTASYAPGYFMCCGNQMAWNLSPVGIKMYFDACDKYCRR
jgi:hypothetical protein